MDRFWDRASFVITIQRKRGKCIFEHYFCRAILCIRCGGKQFDYGYSSFIFLFFLALDYVVVFQMMWLRKIVISWLLLFMIWLHIQCSIRVCSKILIYCSKIVFDSGACCSKSSFFKIFSWFVVSWNCTMFDNFNDKFHTLFRRMSSNVITNCNCNCNGQNLARKVSKVAFWVGMHDFLHCDWKKKSISSQENSRNTKMRGNFVVYFLWLKKPIIYKTSVSRKIAWQFFSEFRLRFQSSSANHSESLRHS